MGRDRREKESKDRSQALDNKEWRRIFWEEERAAKKNSIKSKRERCHADLTQMRLIDKRWRESLDELHKQEEQERARVIEDNGNWRRQISGTVRDLQAVKPAMVSPPQGETFDEDAMSTSQQESSSM